MVNSKKHLNLILILVLFLGTNTLLAMTNADQKPSTFSIVAFDPVMNEWGVAVQSKFLAVGSDVVWAKAGVGALATQAWCNTTYGPEGLALLKMDIPAKKVVEILTSKDDQRVYRQLGVVDANGNAAAWTGKENNEWAGHIVGDGYCVQGNILAEEKVVREMAKVFEASDAPLANRLIAVLQAGQAAGGDRRGKQSAALLVVRENGGYSGYNDRFIDLRVDDHPQPIEELNRILSLHEKIFQAPTYVLSGITLLEKGDRNGADKAFTRALQIAEKFNQESTLLNQIAWELAIRNLDLNKALNFANKAVKLAPENGNIWDTLGEIYARLGNFKEAVKAEIKAVEKSDSPGDFQKKLDKWQQQKD